MIEKLNYFKAQYNNGYSVKSVQEDSTTKSGIENLLKTEFNNGIIISAYSGNGLIEGRNSFCYFYEPLGKNNKTFLKVNAPGNKSLLLKEYEILKMLYGDIIVGFHNIDDGVGVLEMKELYKRSVLNTPLMAKELIGNVAKKLKRFDASKYEMYDIQDLLSASFSELSFLKEESYVKGLYQPVLSILKELEDQIKKLPRVLCHGDYGDANVLTDENGNSVIIDWEDSFWGIDNYDYLYWLTFYNHRKHYSKQIFGDSFEKRKLNISIMILITVIKEAMSVYNGEYKKHSLTAENRISELLIYLNN